MYHLIEPKTAIENNSAFIDVRTREEFLDGSIPGAVNIPVLTWEEREKVSIAYSTDRREGYKLGLKYASEKLSHYFSYLISQNISKDVPIVFFCWRGGMRSKGVADVMGLMKLNSYQLIGGYKGYRKFITSGISELLENKRSIVIHGFTGAGKTEILKKLKAMKLPVIDLEGLANNKGSIFGNINMGLPHTQKTFDSLIYNELRNYSQEKNIVIEAESPRIGNIYLPEKLVNIQRDGIHVFLDTPLEIRVQRILEEYLPGIDKSLLLIEKRLDVMKKKVSDFDTIKSFFNKGDYKTFVELILKEYYDPMYLYSQKKYKDYSLVVNGADLDDSVNKIVDFIYNKKWGEGY